MDNTNEDIIIPKKSKKVPVIDSRAIDTTVKRKKPQKVLFICAGIGIVALVTVLILVLNNNNGGSGDPSDAPESEDTGEIVEVETVYTTPEGVEDAEAAYSDWLEEQKAAAETPEASFDADMQIITNAISQEEYDKAIELLDAISQDDLDTTQLFRLYNVYTRVYEANGDSEKFDEYVKLRDEQLNFLSEDEE